MGDALPDPCEEWKPWIECIAHQRGRFMAAARKLRNGSSTLLEHAPAVHVDLTSGHEPVPTRAH
eukprot:9224269-Lingulodinium_polyedra.AAC.1